MPIDSVTIWTTDGFSILTTSTVERSPATASETWLTGSASSTRASETSVGVGDGPPVVSLSRTGLGEGASATAGEDWHPVLWSRQVGRGRVAFDGLGHDADTINHPIHRRILARAALWATGASETEIAKI